MILYPSCKINLGLHILHKRTDGFHELDTCMFEVPLYDILEIIPSTKFEFSSSGMEIPGDSQNNLCIKAFNIIQNKHDIPNIKMHLHKQIPMGGGLGGGSSDGTYVLKMLNTIFKLNLSNSTLEEYASLLGSDCAFFVNAGSQIAKGRGEKLTPIHLNLNGYYIKIVNIGIHISTPDAYNGIEFQQHEKTITEIINSDISSWKENLKNDFEHSVFKKHAILSDLKKELYEEGAIYASMSGSGSTMYAIYKELPKSEKFKQLNPVYEIIKKL